MLKDSGLSYHPELSVSTRLQLNRPWRSERGGLQMADTMIRQAGVYTGSHDGEMLAISNPNRAQVPTAESRPLLELALVLQQRRVVADCCQRASKCGCRHLQCLYVQMLSLLHTVSPRPLCPAYRHWHLLLYLILCPHHCHFLCSPCSAAFTGCM